MAENHIADMTVSDKTGAASSDRRVRRTKKVLRDSLFKLLSEKNIAHITVKELTDLADVNRSTFYSYYTDIYDMMEQIQDELYFSFFNVIKAAGESVDDVDSYFAYITGFLGYVRENRETCTFFLRNDCNNKLVVRIKNDIRSLLNDSKKDYPLEDPRCYLTDFALSAMLETVVAWMDDGMIAEPEALAKFLSETYAFGAFKQKIKK